jgi:hypothetical protein
MHGIADYIIGIPLIVFVVVLFGWVIKQFIRVVFLGKESKPLFKGKNDQQGSN